MHCRCHGGTPAAIKRCVFALGKTVEPMRNRRGFCSGRAQNSSDDLHERFEYRAVFCNPYFWLKKFLHRQRHDFGTVQHILNTHPFIGLMGKVQNAGAISDTVL